METILAPDTAKVATTFYHKSSIALAVLTPVAFVLSPSSVNLPIDLTLGVLFPVHAHIALNYVISDYVPLLFSSSLIPTFRMGLLGVTVVTATGLLKLNLFGPGLTESIKSLW
eukprot:CAMPEP_0182427498 /NCGR_PEP_ID=MMETSP1167-20130531/17917_1 /TAXON_ID=2988 /ORGANISM="Mallomonas Sp, Strain CCMP3275" /LENGTH=112 /DNA_ID=CAMNT_0024609785 /DNA_START=139 /DNA_END=474 /DNA_ORIENTATION=+